MIKNSLFLFIRLIFTLGCNLYIARVVLSELGVVDFGIYNVIAGSVTMFAFFTNAMSSSTQRFFSFEVGKKNNIAKCLFTTLVIYFSFVVIIILLSQTAGIWFVENKLSIAEEKIYTTYWVYQLAVLSLTFSILTSPFDALLFAFEKFKVYAIFGIVSIILKLLMVILLMEIEFDKLVTYSFIILLSHIFLFLMSCIYCFKTRIIEKIIFEWDVSIFKSLLSFTGWSLFGNFSSVLYNQGVTVLLNIFFGPTINAARGVATQVNSAVLSFSSSINSALAPRIVKKYSTKDTNEMIDIAFLGAKYSFVILTFLSAPVLLFTKELLNIWLTIVPDYTVIFVQLIIFDTLVNGYSGTLKSSVQATGKIKAYQIVIGSMLLLNLPISYLLLIHCENPILPYIVGILLSYIAFNARICFMKRYFDVSFRRFYSTVVLPTLLPFISAIFFTFLIKERYGYNLGSLLIMLIFYFVYMLIIWYFAIGSREKEYFINTIQKLRKNKCTGRN